MILTLPTTKQSNHHISPKARHDKTMKHFSVIAMQQYARMHSDDRDWSPWTPRYYQRLTNPWGSNDRIDTLRGTWYAPKPFHGEFLQVYPEEIAPNGTRYYPYLVDLYADEIHDLWHEECARLTDLHRLGFRRITWEALPSGCQRIFAAEWDQILQDFAQAFSA